VQQQSLPLGSQFVIPGPPGAQLGEPQPELAPEPGLLPEVLPEPPPPDPELLTLEPLRPDDPADDPPLDMLTALDDPPFGEEPDSTGPTPTAASTPLANTSRLRPPHPTANARSMMSSSLPPFIALPLPFFQT
jgi:protein TonB